jgi:alcohol dehydrogenase/L-iditol 2-dehydrogenase
LATGRLNVKPLTGGIWPLAQWHTAFATMHSRQIAKAVLKPN